MGNSNSQTLLLQEANRDIIQIKDTIDNICFDYLCFCEKTSIRKDVDIVDLKAEISPIINYYKELPSFLALNNDNQRSFLENINNYANSQKYSISRLFQILSESYSTFIEIANIINYTNDSIDAVVSDDQVLIELRLLCMSYLDSYKRDLTVIKLPNDLIIQRVNSLRSMLYIIAEEIVKDAVTENIERVKNTFTTEIKQLMLDGMLKGYFKNNLNKSMAIMDEIDYLRENAKEVLNNLPFTHFQLIERANTDIGMIADMSIANANMTLESNPAFSEIILGILANDNEKIENNNTNGEDEEEEIEVEEIKEEIEVEESKEEIEVEESKEEIKLKRGRKSTTKPSKKSKIEETEAPIKKSNRAKKIK